MTEGPLNKSRESSDSVSRDRNDTSMCPGDQENIDFQDEPRRKFLVVQIRIQKKKVLV